MEVNLQEREKSQSRGDFQKMRAKQQMDEDLQGYQVIVIVMIVMTANQQMYLLEYHEEYHLHLHFHHPHLHPGVDQPWGRPGTASWGHKCAQS